jgi:hypothetical protein
MEFMDQMNLFEDPLGLTTDLFVDDLGTEGSILDFGLDGGLKHQSATQESLEDLLLTDTPAGNYDFCWYLLICTIYKSWEFQSVHPILILQLLVICLTWRNTNKTN